MKKEYRVDWWNGSYWITATYGGVYIWKTKEDAMACMRSYEKYGKRMRMMERTISEWKESNDGHLQTKQTTK